MNNLKRIIRLAVYIIPIIYILLFALKYANNIEPNADKRLMNIYLNNEFLQQQIFVNGSNIIYIPKSLLREEYGNLRLEYVDALSPKEMDIGEDTTKLAIRVTKVSFEKADNCFYKIDGSEKIDFADADQKRIFTGGFSTPVIDGDSGYVWTLGNESSIEFLTRNPLKMTVSAYAITAEQPVEVYINNDFIGEFVLQNNEINIDIGEKYTEKGFIHINMVFPNAVSPKEIGNGVDESILAWRICEVLFSDR